MNRSQLKTTKNLDRYFARNAHLRWTEIPFVATFLIVNIWQGSRTFSMSRVCATTAGKELPRRLHREKDESRNQAATRRLSLPSVDVIYLAFFCALAQGEFILSRGVPDNDRTLDRVALRYACFF